MEKIIINPSKVRAYGNIITPKTASDYDTYESTVTKTTDTVYGATEEVFSMSPPVYTMSFDSASYTTTTGSVNVQVTVLNGTVPVPNATVNVNSDTGSTAYQSAMTTNDSKWVASGGNRTITYSSNGCNVTGTIAIDGFYKLDETQVTIPSEFTCTFDITEATEGAYSESTNFIVGNINIRKQGGSLRIGQLTGGTDYTTAFPSTPINIKVEYGESTATVYVNGASVGTWATDYQYIGFKTYSQRSMTVKNLKLYIPNATGTGTTNSNGVANITVTGITGSGTLTATYGFSMATATVTYEQSSYSLAFSQSTYEDLGMGVNIYATLKDNGTAMSGETVTFSWNQSGIPMSGTAVTNGSGVATIKVYGDFGDYVVTASYQTASATCTISGGGGGILD